MLSPMHCSHLAMIQICSESSMRRSKRPKQSYREACLKLMLRWLSGEPSMKLMPYRGLRNWRKPSKIWNYYIYMDMNVRYIGTHSKKPSIDCPILLLFPVLIYTKKWRHLICSAMFLWTPSSTFQKSVLLITSMQEETSSTFAGGWGGCGGNKC